MEVDKNGKKNQSIVLAKNKAQIEHYFSQQCSIIFQPHFAQHYFSKRKAYTFFLLFFFLVSGQTVAMESVVPGGVSGLVPTSVFSLYVRMGVALVSVKHRTFVNVLVIALLVEVVVPVLL